MDDSRPSGRRPHNPISPKRALNSDAHNDEIELGKTQYRPDTGVQTPDKSVASERAVAPDRDPTQGRANDGMHDQTPAEDLAPLGYKRKNLTKKRGGPKNIMRERGVRGRRSGGRVSLDRSTNLGWPRPQEGLFSAIDLGTNNCRLLIAKPTRQGFRVVDAFSRIVRLGEGMDGGLSEPVLSDAAIERSVQALKICADKIDKRGVTCMRHVATEACRVANNTDMFLQRIKAETGLNIEVISAAEEARLAVMGCQSLVAPNNRHAIVFDIGGGSTELIWLKIQPGRRSEIRGWVSVPWGVVNLTEKYNLHGRSVDLETYKYMIAEVAGHLEAFEAIYNLRSVVARRRVQFLGTSGTVTTLASLHLKLPRYIRDRVDGAWMKSSDIAFLSQQVAMMSFEDRAAQPCIGRERADLVVAGCAILDAILSMWPVQGLRVADRGIREGILRGLMDVDPVPVMAPYKTV